MFDFSQGTHSVVIPVMGTGFTIDSPVKVARYGISSVISLVDDMLMERLREYYSKQEGETFEEVPKSHDDVRAARITEYLNLLNRILTKQVSELQASPFEPNSEITKYFEMLPDSPLKQEYLDMLNTTDSDQKLQKQDVLRPKATPGRIEVNIMTKIDRFTYKNGQQRPSEYSDALSGLRGYAQSDLSNSCMVFSAGMNPRLYGYISQFEDFFPDDNGIIKKKVVLKVSDFRSAAVQSKFLIRSGIWVSEYRLEAGLNCGGHAFATTGFLLGPILEEFKEKRQNLNDQLFKTYSKYLSSTNRLVPKTPMKTLFTAQGGIGTAEENSLLLNHYDADATGWATPFLLVPEAVSIDKKHIKKMIDATDDDVYLSAASPLLNPFWILGTSDSENARKENIAKGEPGSPCSKGYLVLNSDYTKRPICYASKKYQQTKLAQLKGDLLSVEQRKILVDDILAKSCICHELGGSISKNYDLKPLPNPTICCGPNIVNFSKEASLREMLGHIYGQSQLPILKDRPHMFVKELMLYIDYLEKEIVRFKLGLTPKKPKYFFDYESNIFKGIEYYRNNIKTIDSKNSDKFIKALDSLSVKIKQCMIDLNCENPYKNQIDNAV